MKIKSGFLMRTIAGSSVVVPIGSRWVDFNGMISLNETGAFLWKMLEEGTTEEEMVKAIVSRYENVDEPTARQSVTAFLASLKEVDCIE